MAINLDSPTRFVICKPPDQESIQESIQAGLARSCCTEIFNGHWSLVMIQASAFYGRGQGSLTCELLWTQKLDWLHGCQWVVAVAVAGWETKQLLKKNKIPEIYWIIKFDLVRFSKKSLKSSNSKPDSGWGARFNAIYSEFRKRLHELNFRKTATVGLYKYYLLNKRPCLTENRVWLTWRMER